MILLLYPLVLLLFCCCSNCPLLCYLVQKLQQQMLAHLLMMFLRHLSIMLLFSLLAKKKSLLLILMMLKWRTWFQSQHSALIRKLPHWHHLYVLDKETIKTKYPLAGCLAYATLSPGYKCFISHITKITKLTSFLEASKDQRWINIISVQIKAL